MIDNKKVSSYLLYAVGEVFLVVLGILIAMQIDNWNEQRKQEKKALDSVKALIKGGESNALSLQSYIDILERKDSLVIKALYENLSPEDYQNTENQNLTNLITPASIPIFETAPYENYLPFANHAVLNKSSYPMQVVMSLMYETNYAEMISSLESCNELVKEYHRHLRTTQPWYTSLKYKDDAYLPTKEHAHYMASNTLYKNYLLEYHNLLNEIIIEYDWYQGTIISMNKQISDSLKLENPPEMYFDSSTYYLTSEDISLLTGNYYREGSEIPAFQIVMDDNSNSLGVKMQSSTKDIFRLDSNTYRVNLRRRVVIRNRNPLQVTLGRVGYPIYTKRNN